MWSWLLTGSSVGIQTGFVPTTILKEDAAPGRAPLAWRDMWLRHMDGGNHTWQPSTVHCFLTGTAKEDERGGENYYFGWLVIAVVNMQ